MATRCNRSAFILVTIAILLSPAYGAQIETELADDNGSENDRDMFTVDQIISTRFAQLHRRGLHAPPLDVSTEALPHEIRTTLRKHALEWRDLSGTLQRLLLWDAGVAVTSQSELVQVYVECGLTMDAIVLPRDQFQSHGCPSRVCDATLTAAGPCPSIRPKCATTGVPDHNRSQVLLWSEEQRNSDIPSPTIFRISHQSSAIHMLASGIDSEGESCPTSIRLAIPCSTIINSTNVQWCVPKPSGVVSLLLETLRAPTITNLSTNLRGKSNVVLPIVWLSVMCVAAVAGIAFVLSRRNVNDTKPPANEVETTKHIPPPVTTVTSENELDFVSIRTNNRKSSAALSSNKSVRSIGGLSSLHNASLSSMDLLHASDVFRAFERDPLVLRKRIPMVDIEFTRRMCQGASGDVFVGRVYGQRVAIKQLLQLKRHDVDELENFAQEIQLTATLDHPNIIRMVGVAWDTVRNLALVLEYRSGGDLLNAIRKRGTRWSWNAEKLEVAMGVARAMMYLHSRPHPLVHRDIKSRNILIDATTMEPALCDFGSSRNVSALDVLSTDPAGTILWTAPEVICAQHYSVKADIFSFGVVLAELDTCALPYTDERDSEGRSLRAIRIAHMVVENKIKPQLSEHCPRFIRELVLQCVKHKPGKRPTAEQVLTRLTDAADDCAALWKSKTFGIQSL